MAMSFSVLPWPAFGTAVPRRIWCKRPFLRARASFAGRSSERGWLFGILRNKLVDYYRLKGREALLAESDALVLDEDRFFHATGLRKGAWIKSLAPQAWASPDESLVQKEFQEVFHRCLARLPRALPDAAPNQGIPMDHSGIS
jgi:DNA-directed RNA polymerase specialized sigma24 family protein